ncbi:hypothetical protein [Phytohabitans rumicis]|uniref:Uncharacterized protein n=1 Tax=Phytohabitans rumicis TaxID=1076125 RepID=A0A6V8LEV8_9ACTN|nr:hypothetical protein [Phytohabitans rumicis]GFJ94200.1 hypothetical protein Prum_078420 [Phytohabitans rumicis]
MTTAIATDAGAVRVPAHHTVTKRLGHWTTAREFEVRSHHGFAVLDLRSPRIPDGEIRIDVDLDRAVLKLLVADDAVIDDWDLHRVGRGKVKDGQGPGTPGGRRIVLTGRMRRAEVRVHRGGVAILSAMFSRAYLDDLRRAHREGGFPTVDDPTRSA